MTQLFLTHRAAIRHYLQNLFIEKVDVGERVFLNRHGSRLFAEELPCMNIAFSDEKKSVCTGSSKFPQSFTCDTNIVVTIAIDDISDADDKQHDGCDLIDMLCLQVTEAVGHDMFLAKNLVGYDADMNYHGLAQYAIEGDENLYTVNDDNGRQLLVTEINFTIGYEKSIVDNKRWYDFSFYKFDLVKTDSTEETTDRLLIGAEGEING